MPSLPDPGQPSTVTDFVHELKALRVWAGNPSFRDLAAGATHYSEPHRWVSHSTVADMFSHDRRRLDINLVVAVLRALGLDEPAVARWRAACVAAHSPEGPAGPIQVLRQLPADLATFTGREQELDWLLENAARVRASAAPTLVITAIEGMAGVGKTQLAVRAAHQLVRAGRFADVQLYVNLRGVDQVPADPAEVLDTFLRALGVAGSQIPASREARAAMFRDRLHGRSTLLLLDNAASEDQVRDLIPTDPCCLVLITSRKSLAGLDGAVQQHLDVFSPAEAVALMASIAGADRIGTSCTAVEIARSCGFLPLAIALVAARFRSRQAWTLEDLKGYLDGRGLDAIQAGGRALRPAFELSYHGLPEQTRRMFRLAGAQFGEDISAEAAAAVTGHDVATAWVILEHLCDVHLLRQPSAGRFSMHDLLRMYAKDLEADADADHAAFARLSGFYAAHTVAASHTLFPGAAWPDAVGQESDPPRFGDPGQASAWLGSELANLLSAARYAASAGPFADAWRLAEALRPYLWEQQDGASLRLAAKAGLRAAVRAGDRTAEAIMRKAAGTAHLISRDMAGALLAFQQAARAAHAAGVSALEAAALSNVALVCQQTNKPAEALLYMRQSALLDSTFEDDPASLSNRGVVLWSVGQLAEAARTYQKALTIACRQGSAYVEAVVRCNLAHTYIDLGRIAEALRLLDDALAGYRTVGSVYGESIALWLSAAAHAASSAHDHALDEADRAIALAEDNGYQRVEGDARCTRGGILAALGQHDQAAAEFEQAAELAAAVDSVEVRVAALVGLASVRSGHDGSEAALTLANQAVDEAARCGFRLLLGRGLAVRAAIYRQLNREDLADTDASMAAEMRRETGVPAW